MSPKKEPKHAPKKEPEKDENPFGDPTGPLLRIDVEIQKDKPSLKKIAKRSKPGAKRKRTPSKAEPPPRDKSYGISTLHDLVRRTEELEIDFETSKSLVRSIPETYFSDDPDCLEDLVGDELLDTYDNVRNAEKSVLKGRRKTHAIATERKALEEDAVRHIPVLRDSLKQDDEEIEFCRKFEHRLNLLQQFVDVARTASAQKIAQQVKKRKEEEEEAHKRLSEVERKKSLAMTMKSNAPEPGMVWNSIAREYQHRQDHTDDDWRN